MTGIGPPVLVNRPGTYALILSTQTVESIAIGKLGTLVIHPGYFVYVGSAFGPGGLNARVSRHLRPSKIKHWHIDYLRPAARVEEVWFTLDPPRFEYIWAAAFLALPGAQAPLKRFGASDCACLAHLIYFPLPPSFEHFSSTLKKLGCDIGRELNLVSLPPLIKT